MKFKKALIMTLIGFVILSAGCLPEKPIPQETSKPDSENTVDSDECLDDENEKTELFSLDFIQQPEELIVFDKEGLDNLKTLNQKFYMVMQNNPSKSMEDMPEEAKDILSQMEAEIQSSKKIHSLNLIESMFDEITTLKAEKIRPEDIDFYENVIFRFDFVDDKNLGLEGNSKEDYIRYLAVMKNNKIIIPIVEKHNDHDHIYYAIVTISEEFFDRLENIAFEE